MTNVESLLDTYKTAVFQKDAEAFLSIFDDEVRIFDMWHWEYSGLPAWRQMVESWFSSLGTERVTVSFEEVRIDAGSETAVVSAYARFAAISESNEELRFLQNRFTWIAREKGGVWKIIHEHTSGPVDGSTMKVLLTR